MRPIIRSGSAPIIRGWVAASYVSPGVCLVSGVDARNQLPVGALVYVPGGGWSSVQESSYSTGTTVYLTDAVCFSGMSALGYVPSAISPTNLCTGGTPISGGNNDAAVFRLAQAFDGTLAGVSNGWLSSQTGAGVSGVAYIGYQFASPQPIRWCRILQANGHNTSSNTSGPVALSKLQYSDDGSSWTDSATFTMTPHLFQLLVAPRPGASHTYWRLLANSGVGAPALWWGVIELQMGV